MTTLTDIIKTEANQCVKCGLCLPHCPTYKLTRDENESPRGRIALMEGLASDKLPLSPRLNLHLDQCLACRACEAVCPSEVKYGQLIDNTRALIAETKANRQLHPRLLDIAVQKPRVLKFFARVLWFYQQSGCAFLFKHIAFRRWQSFLPRLSFVKNWASYYPAQGKEQGRVSLFIGCVTQVVAQDTLLAAIKVLTRCGYGVYVPKEQTCCGALHLHQGQKNTAEKLMHTNLLAFQQKNISAIVTIASGCGATLLEYPDPRFSPKIMDISQFLQEIEWPAHLQLKPLKECIALHTPCTLRNVQQQASAPEMLLKRIPEIKLMNLTQECCGAAGMYMLEHPQMSDALVENTLQHIGDFQPQRIATSNIGCQLHLARALQKRGLAIGVLHPISLIAKQLSDS